jgi:hypothetical protein
MREGERERGRERDGMRERGSNLEEGALHLVGELEVVQLRRRRGFWRQRNSVVPCLHPAVL